MSWFFSVGPVVVSAFGRALKAADESANGPSDEWVEHQTKAAIAAAKALVKSKAVGDGTLVTAHLSGHANPEHKPRPGYSNDFITVTVQCGEMPA